MNNLEVISNDWFWVSIDERLVGKILAKKKLLENFTDELSV